MNPTITTREQATDYMREHDLEVKAFSRQTKAELALMYFQRSGGFTPIRELERWGKDQLLSSLLSLRWPAEKLNFAIHVRYHDVIWPDCPHCKDQVPA
jgi:hypothetical protein